MKFFRNHGFLLFAAGFVLCFIFTRVPYFLNYDIPGFTRGTLDYYNTKVIYLLEGKLPVFERVPPLYPMLLYTCHIIGLHINQVFFVQCLISLLTFIASQYYFNQYLPKYRWIFFITSILFFSSARYINYNTRIEAMGLFTDLMIFTATMMAVSLTTGKWRHYIVTSFGCALLILMRQQGLFVVPMVALIVVIHLFRKQFTQAMAMVVPIFFILSASFIYNIATFGSAFFGKYKLGSDLGKAVFYLDDAANYSPEVAAIIRKVNDSFTDEDRRILRESWSYTKLAGVFDIDHYDKAWEFNALFDSHAAELQRLADVSRKRNFILYVKFVYTNLIKSFVINYEHYYFYYNELVNRIYYLQQSDEFTQMNLPEKDYQIIFKEYADVVLKKQVLQKTGIITHDLEYVNTFADEKLFIRLNHYYQIIFSKLMGNMFWLLILALCFVLSCAAVVHTRFKDPEILWLQIPLALAILNHGLVSISIPPLDSYVYPTRFFLYFYPLSVFYYFINKQWRTPAANSAS